MRISTEHLTNIAEGRFWYLASPYTAVGETDVHRARVLRHQRALIANHYLGWLLHKGVYTYSPIWSCHQVSNEWDLPTDYEWWLEMDKAFIDPSAGVIVAQIDGWRESRGVTYEVEYATKKKLPVIYAKAGGTGDFYLRLDDETPIDS